MKINSTHSTLITVLSLFLVVISFFANAQPSKYQEIRGYSVTSKIQTLKSGKKVGLFSLDSTFSSNIVKVSLFSNQMKLLWSWSYQYKVSLGFVDAYEDLNGNIYVVANGKDSSYVADKNQTSIISFTSSGKIRWQKQFVFGRSHFGRKILPFEDDNFILVSDAQLVDGFASLALSFIDTTGNLLIDFVLFNKNAWDLPHSAFQTSDGGYLISMSHAKNGDSFSDDDCALIKLSNNLVFEWMKTYGGPLRDRDDRSNTMSVVESDDGYYFSTITQNYGARGYDIALMKIDKQGNLLFAKRFGTIGYDYVGTNSLLLFEENLVMNVRFGSKDRLLIFDKNGNLKTQRIIGDDFFTVGVFEIDSQVVLSGFTDNLNAYLLNFHHPDTICNTTFETPIRVFDVTNLVDTASFTYADSHVFVGNVVDTSVVFSFYHDNIAWNPTTLCESKYIPLEIPYSFSRCAGEELEIKTNECGVCNWYDNATKELLLESSSNFIASPDISHLLAINPKDVRSVVTISSISDYTCFQMFIYELVTPNGDLKNDFLKVKNIEYYPDAKISVFDNRNLLVFNSINYQNNWNFEGFEDGIYYVTVKSGLLSEPLVAQVILKR